MCLFFLWTTLKPSPNFEYREALQVLNLYTASILLAISETVRSWEFIVLHHVIKEFPYYDEKDREARSEIVIQWLFTPLHDKSWHQGFSPFFAMGMTVLLLQFLAIYTLYTIGVEMALLLRSSATLCIRFTFRSVGGAEEPIHLFCIITGGKNPLKPAWCKKSRINRCMLLCVYEALLGNVNIFFYSSYTLFSFAVGAPHEKG